MRIIENHMNVGLPYPESFDMPERTESEVKELFADWLERQEDDAYYFEMFLENWHMLELLTFSEQGTMQNEFKKWQAKTLKKEFEQETGEQITSDAIMQEINA